ncbi:MAG: GNAT family N-acetyltransferase [Candidatus Latescibacteria bacterium]|nr:GNAT family N-acetyltransferase [Candidatus Latescibacterota bacterium]
MYTALGTVRLKSGEQVEAGVVLGPDPEWAERVEQLLGHKGPIWQWGNSAAVRRELGIEARYYLLHRQGTPLANISTFTHRGVGHFGHVWTRPEDRRQGAASQLMGLQMAHFRQTGGQALFLGTGYDSAPYHIYASHGFVGLEPKSGNMEFYTGAKAAFEVEFFAKGVVHEDEVRWRHWPASGPLFLGDYPGVVRCAPLKLLGRKSTEGPFLDLIEAEEQRRERGEARRARVLCQTASQAVVALAYWDWDPLWASTCVVDVYSHPEFWEDSLELLPSLSLPAAERYVAYCDPDCPAKEHALALAGFKNTATFARRVAADRARTRLVDVQVWERA